MNDRQMRFTLEMSSMDMCMKNMPEIPVNNFEMKLELDQLNNISMFMVMLY